MSPVFYWAHFFFRKTRSFNSKGVFMKSESGVVFLRLKSFMKIITSRHSFYEKYFLKNRESRFTTNMFLTSNNS